MKSPKVCRETYIEFLFGILWKHSYNVSFISKNSF